MEHYEIFNKIKERYIEIEDEIPLDEIRNAAMFMAPTDCASFESLFNPERTIIGYDARQSDYNDVYECLRAAKEFIYSGANFICINTEPLLNDASYFYFQTASKSVRIPIFRKDPTVCEYQIYQAKILGANAVYLSRFLSISELKHLMQVANSVGMSAAVEVSSPSNTEKAAMAGAKIISVTSCINDLDRIIEICEYTPVDTYTMAYCNIKSNEEYKKACENKVNGIILFDPLKDVKDKKAYLKSITDGSVSG